MFSYKCNYDEIRDFRPDLKTGYKSGQGRLGPDLTPPPGSGWPGLSIRV